MIAIDFRAYASIVVSVSEKSQRPVVPREEDMEGDSDRKGWTLEAALAVFGGVVGLSFLGLSLSHLAEGLAARTGDSYLYSLILAFGIDASIVFCEAALVVAAHRGIQGVRGWATAWLLIVISVSCALNALVFTQGMEWWTISWGFNIFLGCLLPAGVFAVSKIASALVLGGRGSAKKLTRLKEAQVAENAAKAFRRKREKAAKAK